MVHPNIACATQRQIMDDLVCVNVLQDSKWIVDCSLLHGKILAIILENWISLPLDFGMQHYIHSVQKNAVKYWNLCTCNVGYTIQRCNRHHKWRQIYCSVLISLLGRIVRHKNPSIITYPGSVGPLNGTTRKTVSKLSNCASIRSNKFGIHENEKNCFILVSVLNVLITKNGC